MKKVLGNNIRKFRNFSQLRQVDLAEMIGKSARMLQKYEASEVIPSMEVIREIAIALNVSVHDLLRQPHKPPVTPIRGFFTDLIETVLDDDVIAEMDDRITIRHQILDGYINRHITIIVSKNDDGYRGTKNKLKAVELFFHENLLESLESRWKFSLGDFYYPLYDNPDQPIEFSSYGKTFEEAEAEAQQYFTALKREVKKTNDRMKANIEKKREARRAELEKQLEALNE